MTLRGILDGGAPFYGCYACADGKFVALGAIVAQQDVEAAAVQVGISPEYIRQALVAKYGAGDAALQRGAGRGLDDDLAGARALLARGGAGDRLPGRDHLRRPAALTRFRGERGP